MSDASVVQLVGAVALILLGIVFFATALETRRFHRYGREALVIAASFLIVTAGVRLSVFAGLVGTDRGKEINGIVSVVFLVIALETLWLASVETRAQVGITKRHDDAVRHRVPSAH